MFIFVYIVSGDFFMSEFSFNKSERLKSKLEIKALFESGESILDYPVRLLWNKSAVSSNSPLKASASVSKRSFKKAVSRNLLKRRMREAFRLNKQSLTETCLQSNICINLMIIYIGKAESPYSVIESSIIKSLQKLEKKLVGNI